MNRARHYDPVLLGLSLFATLLGLIFIWDAGYARSLQQGRGYIPSEFKQQVIYLFPALLAYWAVSKFHAEKWLKASKVIWLLSLGALIAVEVIGVSMNGAKRWLAFGPVNFQPAEFAKIATIIYLAGVLANRPEWPTKKYKDWGAWLDATFKPKLMRCLPGIWVLASIVLIEMEPDLGTAAVVGAASFAMFWVGGVSKKTLVAASLVCALGVGAMVWDKAYRLERIIHHGDRWQMKNVDDIGYQTVQSELGMANGGIWGVGPGAGRSKHVMPATTTDFVMATVGEEFGLAGSLVVLCVLGAIVARLLYLARQVQSRFKMLVLFGVASWFGVQTCVNFMMANAFLPAIGIPLPFISSGGSSLIALWLGLGVCQAMMLPTPVKKEKEIAVSRDRWGNGGTRVSRSGGRPSGGGAKRGAPVPRVPTGPRG